MTDTIFALSSGALPAGIAVVRISGPDALRAGEALAGTLPPFRTAGLRALHDTAGLLLDRALVLAFQGPGTVTGEDLVELHLHGARAVAAAVLGALAGMPGLRPAAGGEFTRRALLHGRIDLTEAEGLADLLAAETEAQRRSAMQASEGGVRRQVEAWTCEVLGLSARIEAALDHADEEDVDADERVLSQVRAEAGALAQAMHDALSAPSVERLRDGVRVVLAGAPNTGKSTLLNALVEREVAIVSPLAGTTRDRIEAAVQRAGIPYVLTDTAGLREDTADPIEAIGIARARAAMAAADILLWMDEDAPPPRSVPTILLHARSDAEGRAAQGADRLPVSARTGEGLRDLWERIEAIAATLIPAADQIAFNQRQRILLRQAAAGLAEAATASQWLICAEGLRTARHALDAITGRAGVEQLLDDLFGRFCIGK